MSATITATEPSLRPANLTFPFSPTDSDAEWALVGKHSIGYAGPFRVNPDVESSVHEGQLFHGPLVVANVPSWVGSEQRRNFSVVREEGETWLRIGSERGEGLGGCFGGGGWVSFVFGAVCVGVVGMSSLDAGAGWNLWMGLLVLHTE
jgi:hypothetical protein